MTKALELRRLFGNILEMFEACLLTVPHQASARHLMHVTTREPESAPALPPPIACSGFCRKMLGHDLPKVRPDLVRCLATTPFPVLKIGMFLKETGPKFSVTFDYLFS